MNQEQDKAREQISIMQEEWKREQQLVQELEREKEAYRQELTDAIDTNRELHSLNSALRRDIESTKNKLV